MLYIYTTIFSYFMVDWVLWIYGKCFIEQKECIVLRDLNFDILRPEGSSRVWLGLMATFNFTQLVDSPTRVTSHFSTLIDHVFTNTPCNILETNVPSYSISDHFPICITRKPNKPSSQGHVHKFITYRKMDSFDENSFR